MKKYFLLIVFLLFFSVNAFVQNVQADPKIQTARFTYVENFLGLIIYPEKKQQKYPAVIYNYDQTYDWLGEKAAEKAGYNLK